MHRRPFPIVGAALCVMIVAASVLMWTVTKVTAIPPEQLTVPVVPAAKATTTAAATAATTATATAVAMAGAPTAVPSAVTASAPNAPNAVPPAGTPVAKSPAPAAVSVTLTSFAYDPDASTPTAEVSVHVTTIDSSSMTLVLYYAGGDAAGQAGSNAGLQDEFTLSGRTSYDIADRVTALQFCYTSYFGVTASLANVKNTPSAEDFRQLQSPSCS